MAFGSTREGIPGIWAVDAGGGTPREYGSVTFESGNLLAWSPAQSITYQLPGDQDFMMLDPSTMEQRPLTSGNTDGWLYDPRPAPDNRRIAIHWRRSPAESTGTWLLSPEQPTQRFVIGGFFPIGWSTDGESLYAMQQANRRDKSQDVYRIRLNTATPELLITLPVSVMPWEVSITPDGRLIVAAAEERQSDAWLVKNFDPSR
jgi:Tol biopolymer transport system component